MSEDRLGELVLKRKWLFLALSFALLAISIAGTTKLKMITDSRAFFAKDNPMLVALNQLEDTYAKNEVIILALEPEGGTVFTNKTLSAVEWLTEEGWKVPYSKRVDSLTNYQHTYAKEDDLIVEDLIKNPGKLTAGQLERAEKIALLEPSLVDKIISKTGHVTTIIINTQKPEKQAFQETEDMVFFIRDVIDEFYKKYDGIKLHLAGNVPFDQEFVEEANKDMATLLPAMFVIMVIVTWLSLRSITATIATLMVIVFSATTGMGLSGWLGIMLSDVASLAPTIILTLAVADSIHILNTIMQEMRHGKSKDEAIKESLRVNAKPVFITSITTVIGFLSMNFSDAPPFHDLGNIVAMGVASAYLYSVYMLPVLIHLLPIKAGKDSGAFTRISDHMADFIISYRKTVFWGMAGIILFLISGIHKIVLDDNFIEYVSEKNSLRISAEFLMDNVMGLDSIEYSIHSGNEGGINDPEYLKNLEKLENWFKKQKKVVHIDSINDVMRRLNKTMHGDKQSWYTIPDNRQLAAQYLLLYEMSLPFGLDLTSQVNLDKSASRFTVTLANLSSAEIVRLEKKADKWIEENLPPVMHAKGTGLAVMFAHLSENNIKSMLKGTALALLLISIILIFSIGDMKVGLLSLIPNMVPALMAFGIWGYTVGEAGLAVSIVAALSLGIVVDDTVHFLSKYVRGKKEKGLSGGEAVRYSFHAVGRAILITTLILVAGFMVLAQSEFLINGQMGLLTATTILFALLVDFLFLPTLLLKLEDTK